MKKSIIKIMTLMLVALCICSIMMGSVYADGVYKSASAFDGGTMPSKANKMLKNAAENIIVIIRIVGVAVALGILIVIGMRYMIAAPSEKADLKKYAINYTIAAVIIFGASNIIAVIYNFSKVVTKS